MTVRSRLKLLIAERNLERIKPGLPEITLRQIAAESQLPLSTVSGLTSGRAGRVDFRTLDKLCRYFNVQPGELLEYVPVAKLESDP
jgi:DNA-binding Xre family transcriptional regulator